MDIVGIATTIAVFLLLLAVWLHMRMLDQSYRLHYTRGLIEASLDPLVAINSDGIITDANKAMESVTGFAREKLIGTKFSSCFAEPDRARDWYERTSLPQHATSPT